MVQDIIEINLYAMVVRGIDHGLEVGLGAILRIDRIIIFHIVGMIGMGGMDGREPQPGYAQLVEIIHPGGYALEIAYAVAVAVAETVHQQLV